MVVCVQGEKFSTVNDWYERMYVAKCAKLADDPRLDDEEVETIAYEQTIKFFYMLAKDFLFYYNDVDVSWKVDLK
jgi:hypothetical protein